jgi:hypothetical protein
MFASNTLSEHILRGAIGIAALGYALAIAETHPWGSLASGALALLAFRGCPICWTIGLFETARQQSMPQKSSTQQREEASPLSRWRAGR